MLSNDTKYAFRQLMKNPGFTIVAVVTLAVGISANITMFSVVNAVLLRRLPFDNPDWLVVVQQHSKQHGFTAGLSYPDFLDWRKQDQIFDDFAAYTAAQFDLIDGQGVSKVDGATVSPNFFSMLGTSAFLGRVFAESDEQQDYGLAAVISYDFWQNRFGKSREILGRTVTLHGKVYTVIGVLPPGFTFPDAVQGAQIWTVLKPTGDRLTNSSLCWLSTVGRLKPGVSIEQAVNLQNQRIAASGDDDTEILMTGLHDRVVRGVRTTLWILSVIVGFILLIVCANVANLCLARASARDKEIAVRLALGANKLRLFRQFLTESLVLSVLGGVVGLVLTLWTIAVFRVKIGGFVPMTGSIHVEPRVLLYGLVLSILVGILLGIIPFWWTQRSRLAHVLTERRNISGHRSGFSNLLVAGQIAVALVLSIGMVLMIRSMARLSSAPVGFEQENLITFNISAKGLKEPRRYQLSQDLLERLKTLPYVKAASTDSSMPCSPRASSAPVEVEGYQAPEGKRIRACIHNVSPDYFRTLQIPILKGRDISLAEHQKKESVVLVNETLARLFWPDQDPTGRMLDFCGVRYQVIGVVADMIQGNVKIDKPNHLFFPFDKVWPGSELKVVVRSSSGPGPVVQQARAMLRQIDTTLPLYGVSTFKAQMNACISQERFTTTFLTVFAAIALLLIVIGVYGVVSYAVAQRTREIGVRMALGAQKTSILAMILKGGLVLSIGGSVVGIAGATCLTRFLSSYLFEISATDPLAFVLAPLIIIAVATLACYIPARRAAKIDPMEALRCE
ncbi:MAG: ABC transporter permease [Sedimentisphaerales bacterium]